MVSLKQSRSQRPSSTLAGIPYSCFFKSIFQIYIKSNEKRSSHHLKLKFVKVVILKQFNYGSKL